MSDTAIWWLRRDLRLADNDALAAALAGGRRVVPLFILDPVLLDGPTSSPARTAFLLGGLRALDADLRARGSRLVVRRGRPAVELARVVAETGATAAYAEDDHSPYARRRDAEAQRVAPLHLVGSAAIRPPGTVLKADGAPYTVFTPFSRAWLAQPLPDPAELRPAPAALPDPGDVAGERLPDAPALPPGVLFPPGEAEAQRRLAAFLSQGIAAYDDRRDRLDVDGTSRLSPYLRFGMVAARAAAVAALSARRAGAGAGRWLNELIWRDFYIHILYHFPHVATANFRSGGLILWRNDSDDFAAWREGRTGYPIVDAAMRQLDESGWMHNRARMIVASFLVKDLLIDWRWGERWFMRRLVDGDPAANNGGWQWSAGTGTDAAPYFRVFNPVTQGRKFDPDGDYVRRWLPALAGVPTPAIHEPWRLSPAEQRAAGCVLGRDYPYPIIDHALARQRALDAYAAREND
jgi:deoxyribodipyrimidine photo-lyase